MNFSTKLREHFPGAEIRENVPLGKMTTFRCGGNAACFVSPKDARELSELLTFLRDEGEAVFLLGRGSNILVSDSGFSGTVLSMREHFSDIAVSDDGKIRAGSGALMPDVSREALSRGLSGLEFMAGIPGTIGGGVRMNAGAYGSEIRDIILEATLLLPDGTVRYFKKDELALSYRHSRIPELSAVVIEAVFQGIPKKTEEIRARMDDLQQRRRDKQPLNYGSAGSTFKRPEGYFAGKLIQDAGMKGFRIGDAAISEKHAGFVVNLGSASSSDVYRVISAVQREVMRQFSVRLEREVILLGDFPEEDAPVDAVIQGESDVIFS